MKWILVLITLALVNSLFAEPRQWDLDGVAVRQAYDVQWFGKQASGDDGSVMMVWTLEQGGSPELYGQLLSPNGEPLWEEGGRFLARTEGLGVFYPAIAYSSDGWIVAWLDLDVFNEDEVIALLGRVKAMKYSASGQPMWADPEQDGALVHDGADVSFYPEFRIADDGAGGVFFHWSTSSEWFLQRVTSTGTTAWAIPVELEPTRIYYTYEIAADGLGNVIVSWITTAQNDVYCQKFGPDGIAVWPMPVVVCDAPDAQSLPRIVADGQGGALLTWNDPRVNGYRNIYAQRVNSDGVPQWQEDGILVVTDNEIYGTVRIAQSRVDDQVDGLVLSWSEPRVGDFYPDVYVQKLSMNGTLVWGEGGVRVCDAENEETYQESNRITSDGQGGALVTWREYQSTSESDLRAARLNTSGQPTWADCVTMLQDSFYFSSPIFIAVGSNDHIILMWHDYYGINGLLHSQSYSLISGNALGAPFVLDDLISGDASEPTSLTLSPGRTAFVWTDTRGYESNLYFKILASDGSSESVRDGEKLIEPLDQAHTSFDDPRLFSDGSGGFFATYEEHSSISGVINNYITRRTSEGERVGPPQGRVISASDFDQRDPFCVPDGSGGAFIAWSGFDATFQLDVYVARVNSQCQAVWNEAQRIVLNLLYDDVVVGLVSSSNSSCIVVYQTGDWGHYRYLAARVLANGEMAWTVDVTPTDRNAAWNLHVVSDGHDGAGLAWSYDDADSTADARVQHLSANGSLRWPIEGIPVNSSPQEYTRPRVAMDELGNIIVANYYFDNVVGEYAIRVQKVSPNGDLMWSEGGRVVAQSSDNMSRPVLEVVNSENIYVAWTESDYGLPNDYYERTMATHLNAHGELAPDPFWQGDTGAVISNRGTRHSISNTVSDGLGGIVISWIDIGSNGYPNSLYAQRFFDPIPLSADEKPSIPTEFSLSQNYPNPFNPETSIEFALPTASKALLKVFDVTGREVATLLNKPLSAGTHRVQFDATRLPSGVYFYTLRADNHTATRKMVLIR